MKETPENQMGSCSSSTSSSCFFRHPSISFALLTFLILSSFFSSLLFSTLLTFSVLVLSTVVLLNFTKEKKFLEERNPMKAEYIDCGRKTLPEMEPRREIEPENKVIATEAETEESQMGQILADLSSTSGSDSDDWLYNVGQIPAHSDCSISDDESLIEIALSDECHANSEEDKQTFRQNPPELLPESLFRRHGLMELLSEINEIIEEDNLIEIDIAVGSIKCSRLEIETPV